MKKTIFTQIMDEKKGIIYETEEIVMALDPEPVVAGQIVIFPKKVFPIIELIDENIWEEMWIFANKASIALFEEQGVKGTNVLIKNGIPSGQTAPHASISVIPRKENDQINLDWLPKELSEEEMGAIEMKIREESEYHDEDLSDDYPSDDYDKDKEELTDNEEKPEEKHINEETNKDNTNHGNNKKDENNKNTKENVKEKDMRIEKLNRIARW